MDSDLLQVCRGISKNRVKFTKLAQRVLSNHESFAFVKNHFLLKFFDKKLVQLVESEIAAKYVKDVETWYRPPNKTVDDDRFNSSIRVLDFNFGCFLFSFRWRAF